MLRLKTPIIIGSQTYDTEIFGRYEGDMRSRSVEFQVVPAQEKFDHIRVAREKGGEIRSAPPIATVQLQDRDDDPAIAAAFAKLVEAFEAFEQLIVDELATKTYQLGEDDLSLEAIFEHSEKPYKNERVVEQPAQEEKEGENE